jgi:hypothetical protein
VAQNAGFGYEYVKCGRSDGKIVAKYLIQNVDTIILFTSLQKLAETDKKYKELINFIGTSTRDNGLISSSMSKIGPKRLV